ncbi:MAG: hypothetical protein IJY27_05790 [Clostridia bacterium]|nr:hypothetical protein [Clostridia bacterium]
MKKTPIEKPADRVGSELCEKGYITEQSVWEYIGGKYSPSYFIRHIFYYLWAHPELLDDPEYRCLYEETSDFQIRHTLRHKKYTKSEEQKYREVNELMAELTYADMTDKFDEQTVNKYLIHRRAERNVAKNKI